MHPLSKYITFLKEYKKLLERGVKDVLNSSISKNFIWNDNIIDFVSSGISESTLPEIFSSEFKRESVIFTIDKPRKPNFEIPKEFEGIIQFNEAKDKFESVNENIEEETHFINTESGKNELKKLENYKKSKTAYSKLYRAYNDLKNDTNLEIVLSVGLIQYAKRNRNKKLSKTNQHLFHFPLKIEIDLNNKVKVYLNPDEQPYADFFFLNNTPIEKSVLTNIVDCFNSKTSEIGYEYLFEPLFEELISKFLQQISSNSVFEDSVFKPEKDYYKEDYFNISYAPAINIKQRKPRFFEKLTDSIVEYTEENNFKGELFNLLIRNPQNENNNTLIKSNYFKEELYRDNIDSINHLRPEEDFTAFFPLPFNKEQKEIYENYLKNRLTVVTGPPGTGKSHTIVNILCSLLAQGKKVLVTAQTDKALESLLEKVPKIFDNLVFTKIELETDPNRFSLEKSIGNISKILKNDSYSNVKQQIKELDKLKGNYLNLKSKIKNALEIEYSDFTINEYFEGLRAYEIVDKLEKKRDEEWNWIKDILSEDDLKEFDDLENNIVDYLNLDGTEFLYSNFKDFDIIETHRKLSNFNFSEFLKTRAKYHKKLEQLGLDEDSKERILKLNLEKIKKISSDFSSSDVILKNKREIVKLREQINHNYSKDSLKTNKTFTDLVENNNQYLIDIETLLSLIDQGKEKVGFLKKISNSTYKRVRYLEEFTINGIKCQERKEINKLRELIRSLKLINNNFTTLKNAGFKIQPNENSALKDNISTLNKTLEDVDRNFVLVNQIQFDEDFIYFSKFTGVNQYDIDQLGQKSISYQNEFNELRDLENKFKEQKNILLKVSETIGKSSLKKKFKSYLPFYELKNKDLFAKLKTEFNGIKEHLNREKKYASLIQKLKEKLPLTFENLDRQKNKFITKENFSFAAANEFLQKNEFIDLQKCKEELIFINRKIYEKKCNILFDLAKDNFKNQFSDNEVNSFINLLNQYESNLKQSVRSIRDKVKFQRLVRQNGANISKHLSCWVMKFNDVLNSVGKEPETFDCIIVDEASQLDFMSLLLSYYSENMIVVGDDKQTSPPSLTGADGNDFEAIKNKYLDFLGENSVQIRSDNSLFTLAKMVAGTSNLNLVEHFRCVPEIIEFSKLHFYDNSLRPLKQINSDRLKPKVVFFVSGAYTEDQVVYNEIEEIKKYLIKILNNEAYQEKTIGVVSLGLSKHTERLKNIKEELAEDYSKEKLDKHKLIIENSPKFQGDERDVMIVSLGVALDSKKLLENKNPHPRAIINDEAEKRKINVALSRAKEQMVLFHSIKSEDLRPNDFRNEVLKFFYEEVKPLPALVLDEYEIERMRYNVPKPFDSWFEYDIAKSLISNGFKYIQPQYKVKEDELYYNHKLNKNVSVNFKLDLVVHNNGKMVAIECDGDPFHSLPEDVAYDVERQEFLERVGWKVYRILYSSYKRTPQEEIDKLITYIKDHTKKDQQLEFIQNINNNRTQLKPEIEINSNTTEKKDSKHLVPANPQFKEISKSENQVSESPNIPLSQTNNDLNLFNQTKVKEEETYSISDGNQILCYFNLFENSSYKIQEEKNSDSIYTLPIQEKHKSGYLLQCYDNGCVNKVMVKSILEKRMDYQYSNGKNPNAKLLYLTLINSDCLISLVIKKENDTLFKIHKTENISSRKLLHLKGYKVLYQAASKIQFKILPFELEKDLDKLIFKSFNATGKSIYNDRYKKEWKIIRQFIPDLK